MSIPEISDSGVVVGAATHEGRVRDHNEDALRVPAAVSARDLESKGACFVVCDGVGGLQAGEVASEAAAKAAIDAYYAGADAGLDSAVRQAVQAAHNAVQKAQLETQTSMASTIVIAAIRSGRLCVANVGDSRCYLWRKGRLNRLSTDHSWINAQLQAGVISPEEARQSSFQNVLTRSLGLSSGRPGQSSATSATAEPDVVLADWLPGDKLLLCSDGIWNMVRDEEISRLLQTAGASAQHAAEALVQAANAAGGTDNVTAVVAVDPSQPTDVVRTRRPSLLIGLIVAVAVIAIALAAWQMLQVNRQVAPDAMLPTASPKIEVRILGQTEGTSREAATATPLPTAPATPDAPTATAIAMAATASEPATEATGVAVVAATVVQTEVVAVAGTAAGTADVPQATATQANVVGSISFCRTPIKGKCQPARQRFESSGWVTGVWNAEALRNAKEIKIQWTLNNQTLKSYRCIIDGNGCRLNEDLSTQSRIEAKEPGDYRLDIFIEEQLVLSSSFTVK